MGGSKIEREVRIGLGVPIDRYVLIGLCTNAALRPLTGSRATGAKTGDRQSTSTTLRFLGATLFFLGSSFFFIISSPAPAKTFFSSPHWVGLNF